MLFYIINIKRESYKMIYSLTDKCYGLFVNNIIYFIRYDLNNVA